MKKLYFLLLFLFITIFLFSEWTIVETFSVPEGASGLAWDGTYLYCGIYGTNGDEIYQIDPTDGSAELLFSDPELDDTYGLTYDGTYLWLTDHRGSSSDPAIAYQYDMDGNSLTEIELPDHYMSGIAYDNGDFWVSTYYDPDGEIYKIDAEGNILQQFAAPDEQPWDLCLENEFLWMADYWGDTLYKIDPETGNMLESYPSEGTDPAGIVYDGQYLWYCDNGSGGVDYLYKVDLGGGGTPVISLDWDEYNFGNTVIGDPDTVELAVTNTGTADLEITQLQFSSPNYSAVFQPPLVVIPDATEYITISFDPDDWGEEDCQFFITSNDPVNPIVEITLTGYGIFSEQEIVLDQEYIQWNYVRAGAVSGLFLNISNQGNETLIIDELFFNSDLFFTDDTVELPLNLTTREEYNLRIWFAPEAAGQFDAFLAIHNNDSDENPASIVLQGNSIEDTYPIATPLWEHLIDTSWDNSPKAIDHFPDVTNDDVADVIVCSEDGYVRCFNGNASNWADLLWQYELPAGYVYSQKGLSPGIDIDNDGYHDLVVGTAGGDKAIRMISGKTGALIWEYYTSEFGEGGWVYEVDWRFDYDLDDIPDVLACAGDDANDTGPKRVFCLDGETGDVIWTHYVGGPVFSVQGIEDINNDGINDVIAGASNQFETEGKVIALDGTNGSVLWDFVTLGSSVWGITQVDDFTGDGILDIVAGDFYGNYYGLNADNGNSVWSGSIGNYVLITDLQLLDDVNEDEHPDILIANSSNNAKVIDGYSGGYVWDYYLGDNSLSIDRIPDINGDLVNDVLVGCLNDNAYFLDGTDGDNLGSYNLNTPVDAIAAIPDINNDLSWEMVAGGRNGALICLSGGLDAIVDSEEDEIQEQLAGITISNYPNPFNPNTTISFSLNTEDTEGLELKIFNVRGQLIRSFNDQTKFIEVPDKQNTFMVNWNGHDDNGQPVSSGIYFTKVLTGNSSAVTKMMLLK